MPSGAGICHASLSLGFLLTGVRKMPGASAEQAEALCDVPVALGLSQLPIAIQLTSEIWVRATRAQLGIGGSSARGSCRRGKASFGLVLTGLHRGIASGARGLGSGGGGLVGLQDLTSALPVVHVDLLGKSPYITKSDWFPNHADLILDSVREPIIEKVLKGTVSITSDLGGQTIELHDIPHDMMIILYTKVI